MRRLYSRWACLEEGWDPAGLLPHEGTLVRQEADEGPWLRPMAGEVPLPDLHAEGAPEDLELLRALELERIGRRLEAIATLQQLLAIRPDHVAGRVRLALLVEATGDAEEAAALLTGGLLATPEAAPLLEARGALLGRLARHAEAEADLRRSLALEPERAGATLSLGLTLLRRGRREEALAVLERAVALRPADGLARLHLGEARYQTGDLQGALTDLRQATGLLPDDPRPFALAGRLLDRLGRADEALEMHRQARLAGRT